MFPKKRKFNLRENKDFFETALSFSTPYFKVFTNKNDSLLQASVIVPKKMVKLAVDRNKIKRKVWEALQTAEKGTQKEVKLTIVLVAHQKVLKASAQELEKEITTLIQKCQRLLSVQ